MDKAAIKRWANRLWSPVVSIVTFFGYVYSDEIKAFLSRLSVPVIWFDPILAIFAVLMIIGAVTFVVNEISRLRAKKKPILAVPIKSEVEAFYPSRDALPILAETLRHAKNEIWCLGTSLETISTQNRDTVKQLIKDGIRVVFIALNPEAKCLPEIERALGSASIAKALERSLDELCNLKRQLSDVEKNRLEIRTYDLIPLHNIVAIDASSDNGLIRVEAFQYSSSSRSWVSFLVSKKNQPALFDRYWNSYRFVLEKSVEYTCPENRVGLF